jgi:hypothetical protein
MTFENTSNLESESNHGGLPSLLQEEKEIIRPVPGARDASTPG